MDKIQAAIAKARAARKDIAQTGAQPAPPPPPRRLSKLIKPMSFEEATKIVVEDPAVGVDRPTTWKPLATCAPSARQMARQRVVSFSNGPQKSSGATAFDMLRTKILQQMDANGWRRLAITSPGAGCGKSTVTLNLAFSLSKQQEVYAIVGEMDMRRPSLALTLGVSGDTSFSAVIDGRADFADVARRPRPNLAFGLNYKPARNPSELLQSSTVGNALADIESKYSPDLMIFDLPPMLHSDDAMAFMGQVDCVLLVAAAESTSISEIDICERDLAAQTNVMGVMLNKCRYMEKGAGSIGYD